MVTKQVELTKNFFVSTFYSLVQPQEWMYEMR